MMMRKEIVEIVRDTASQLTDGFHFLRLPQGLLGQLAALGLRVKASASAGLSTRPVRRERV